MSPQGTRQRQEPQSEQQSAGNPHVCTSCGRACRACAEAAAAGHPLPHTIRMTWCRWCAEVYAENSPAEDGRVWCQNPECEYTEPFPTLAVLIEQGVARYPAYCRDCRGDGRRAARLAREVQADPRTPLPAAEQRPAERAAAPRPLDTTPMTQKDVDERERNWARGGFRPRPPGPDVVESEHGDGETAWPGPTYRPQ